MQDKVYLPIKLKEHEDVELETNNVLSLLQRAAKKLLQTAIPKGKLISYPTKLRDK